MDIPMFKGKTPVLNEPMNMARYTKLFRNKLEKFILDINRAHLEFGLLNHKLKINVDPAMFLDLMMVHRPEDGAIDPKEGTVTFLNIIFKEVVRS